MITVSRLGQGTVTQGLRGYNDRPGDRGHTMDVFGGSGEYRGYSNTHSDHGRPMSGYNKARTRTFESTGSRPSSSG